MALIQFTDRGLYCPPGNFYIDPWKPVDKALITHAHSDHARWGSVVRARARLLAACEAYSSTVNRAAMSIGQGRSR